MARIITVRGEIDPGELGVTYAHEHLFGGPPAWSEDSRDADLRLDSFEAAVHELGLFRLAGGQTIVEMSTPDYGRRPDLLYELSARAGVHIIMATGLHKHAYSHPLTARTGVQELAEGFARDVQFGVEGVEGVRVRAGVIKAATSLNTITPGEEKVLRAAARAHLVTGAPISTHTQAGTMGFEQIAILREEGVDPSRIAIGHVDRRLDYGYHREMLQSGVYLIYDQIGKEKYAPDRERIAMLIRLVSEGYGHRLMLAGDFGRASYWTSHGGGPGFTYIMWRFVPWLISEGLPASAARDLLVHNPARFFAVG
jgi:phosphotriesterase-related protein